MHRHNGAGLTALACCGLVLAGPAMAQAASKSSAGVPAAAATARLASPADALFPLDVAGVRLGMSPAEARAAMTKAGYRVGPDTDSDRAPSFAESVTAAAARRRTGSYVEASRKNPVVTRIEGVGPNRESARIRLVAVPTGGSVVAEVYLDVPTDLMTGAAFLKQAEAKYGRPDGRYDNGMVSAWCSRAVRRLCAVPDVFGPSPGALPNLKASTILFSNTIRLDEGSERAARREREFAAAVDRATPKTDRAAF